jgi:hypothetical protein
MSEKPSGGSSLSLNLSLQERLRHQYGTQELRKENAEPNRPLGGKHAKEEDDLSFQ